jgi:hypothetical protein
MLNIKWSIALLTISILSAALIYGIFIDREFDEIYEYERAKCSVIEITSTYSKCCHFVENVCMNSTFADSMYNVCDRRYIPLEKNAIILNTQYCREGTPCLGGENVRKLNCGKCSEHSVIFTSLAPSPIFILNVTHFCNDVKKIRCTEKIFDKFSVNKTVPCWAHQDHLLIDTPLIVELVLSGIAFFICLIAIIISIALVTISYKQYRKQLEEMIENDRYEFEEGAHPCTTHPNR